MNTKIKRLSISLLLAFLVFFTCAFFVIKKGGVVAEMQIEQKFSDMFVYSGGASGTDYVTSPSYHVEQKTGVEMKIPAQDATIEYKGIVNMKECDLNSPLFSLIFTPQKKNDSEFASLYFEFIDCFDESNVLTFKIYSPGAQYSTLSCVSAYAGTQKDYAMTWQSWQTSMYGTTDSALSVYFDYSALAAYANPDHYTGGITLVRNLTDVGGTAWLNGEEEPWTGFSSGYCYVRISATVLSSDASFLLLDFNGHNLTKEQPDETDNKIDLLIDPNGYDFNVLPNGVLGATYPIFGAKAYSDFEGCKGNVYPLVVKKDGTPVPIVDGRFATEETGVYYILYKYVDTNGVTATRRFKVNVQESYEEALDYEFSPEIVTSAKVGETVFLYPGEIQGGHGRVVVQNELMLDNETIAVQNEGKNDFFIPVKADKYVLRTMVTDFLGTKVVKNLEINVAENEDVIEVGYVPTAVRAGEVFNVPTAKAIGEVQTYINNELYTEATYVPTDSFELKYSLNGYEEIYNVAVVEKLTGEGFLKSYFHAEGGSVDFSEKGQMILSNTSEKARFVFAKTLHSQALSLSFSLIEGKENFAEINFYFQDAEIAENEIKITVKKSANSGGYVLVCGDLGVELEITASLYSSYVLNLDADGTISDAIGNAIGQVEYKTNFRLFDGFDGYVYLTTEIVGDSSAIVFAKIGNQIISNVDADYTPPTLIFSEKPAMIYRANVSESFTIAPVSACDELSSNVVVTVQVKCSAETVYTGNGRESYTFTLSQRGTYRISFMATDENNNKVVSNTVINVVDTQAPEISLKKHSTTARVGKEFSIASYTVKDNFTATEDIKVYAILQEFNGKETFIEGDKVTVTVAGVYTIRYVAIDEDGNIASVEYTVEVK